MANAVIDTALLYVKRYGEVDFAAESVFNPATETQLPLSTTALPIVGLELTQQTVVAGAFVALTPAQNAAVTAFFQAQALANASGSLAIAFVTVKADLPRPPPLGQAPILLAAITDGPGGRPALVIADTTDWYQFTSAVIPP